MFQSKAGVTWARNLRNSSGNFLKLCVDAIIVRQNLFVETCLINCTGFWLVCLQYKTGGTQEINLRKFSSRFLWLCVDVILLGNCSSTHECRDLPENLRKFLARVSLQLKEDLTCKLYISSKYCCAMFLADV